MKGAIEMISAINTQIRLMCEKKSFRIGFSLSLGYVLLTYLYYVWYQYGSEISTILSPDAIFPLHSDTIFYSTFINIVPFIIVIPFATSFVTDNTLYMLPTIQSRMSVKTYYYSKSIACFAGSFLIFFIPFIVSMILNHLTFPQSGVTFWGDMYDLNFSPTITGDNVMVTVEKSGILFPKLYLVSASSYNLLFSAIFSIAMGICSVFVFSLSFIMKKFKIFLFIPFYFIVVLFNTIDLLLSGRSPYTCLKIMPYITINAAFGKSPIFIAVFFLVIIAMSQLLLYKQSKSDQLG